MRGSPLGRETAIQKLVWEPGEFPRLAPGGTAPTDSVPAPDLPDHSFDPGPERMKFLREGLPIDLQLLRTPHLEGLFLLAERPGALRLSGRKSPALRFD